MKLRRRAEAGDPEKVVETFVDVGPLFARLSSPDHQIMSGRRGTGKTHALTFLDDSVRKKGALPIFVDMRTIGSTGGLYADHNFPIAERGTRLLCDTLGKMHDVLVDYTLGASEHHDLAAGLTLLDRFADEITNVVVLGESEEENKQVDEQRTDAGTSLGAKIDVTGPGIQAGLHSGQSDSRLHERMFRTSGTLNHRVHFGAVTNILTALVEALPVDRIWILIDEWSDVPMELQPLLADLLRRALFPVRGLTVKIAAIEQRSNFRAATDYGGQIGIEVGADAAADLDLDDFMVFGNDAEKAKDFFRELLFRHVRAIAEEEEDVTPLPATPQELIRRAFTQRTAFDEFVRAAEGVPRDAINILMLAAQRAGDDAISVDNVRGAARDWYARDKEKAVSANPKATALLHWTIDKVIGERRARAFLLQQGERTSHPLIGALYDARVLHVVKKSVATHDRPGVRYDVYGLDYGCYVELVTTAKAPLGLFQAELNDGSDSFVEVPTDDYRSIRRAILDLDEFEQDFASRLAERATSADS
jgi:hypothetical protein